MAYWLNSYNRWVKCICETEEERDDMAKELCDKYGNARYATWNVNGKIVYNVKAKIPVIYKRG